MGLFMVLLNVAVFPFEINVLRFKVFIGIIGTQEGGGRGG